MFVEQIPCVRYYARECKNKRRKKMFLVEPIVTIEYSLYHNRDPECYMNNEQEILKQTARQKWLLRGGCV